MPTNVLVVVDDIDMRRLIVASIANDGHPVTVAPTMAEALKVLRASPTSLVAFFDYQLPDGTSLDVLPSIAMGGPAMQRHRYVMLTDKVLDAAARESADRFGVAVFAIPCVLGDVKWEITKKVRELDAAETGSQVVP